MPISPFPQACHGPTLLTAQAPADTSKVLKHTNTDAAKPREIIMNGMDRILAIPALDPHVKAKGGLRSIYIFAHLYFRDALELDSIRQIVKQRVLPLERFHSRASAEHGKYIYKPVGKEEIKIEDLVFEVADIHTQNQLDDFCFTLYDEGLSLDLPLWRCYVINGLEHGRSLLMWQIDHCLGDGEALVQTILSVLDKKPDVNRVMSPVKEACQTSDPGCIGSLKSVGEGLFNIVVGDRLPGDEQNQLKIKDYRNPHGKKTFSVSPPIDLQNLKNLKQLYPGATINDLLLAVATLTLRAYYLKHDPRTVEQCLKVRGIFPINMRSPTTSQSFADAGNVFSQGIFRFPLESDSPAEVISKIQEQTSKIKSSPEPAMRKVVMDALASSCLSPSIIADLALDAYAKVTAMVSNVVGPPSEVTFGGQPVDDMYFHESAPFGLFVGIVSYNGKVRCGFSVSADCDPDARNLSTFWADAFDKF